MKKIRAAVAVLALGVLFLPATPASAVQVGQFCAASDAGALAVADDGTPVRCEFNPNSDRHHWVARSVPPAQDPTFPPSETGIITPPPNQTGIISITPAPETTTTTTGIPGAVSGPGVAPVDRPVAARAGTATRPRTIALTG